VIRSATIPRTAKPCRRENGPGTHALQAGPANESDRLRPLFLVWVGKRSYAAALKAAGIDYGHGMKWLAGGILREEYQRKVGGLW
jgi:hypothetical protein